MSTGAAPAASLAGVEAIVFDLFDTLVDNRFDKLPRIERNGRRFPTTLGWLHEDHLSHHGVPFDDFVGVVWEADSELHRETYDVGLELSSTRRFTHMAERLAQRFGIDAVDRGELARALYTRHLRALREHTELPLHHPELLARLAARYPLALCSNFSDTATALRILDEFGLAPHLSVVVVSETTKVRKPGREIFDVVLGELQVRPEAVLHVGDSLRADVGGAAPLGMHTAWITRRVRDAQQMRSEWEGPAPTLEIADLAELETHLGLSA